MLLKLRNMTIVILTNLLYFTNSNWTLKLNWKKPAFKIKDVLFQWKPCALFPTSSATSSINSVDQNVFSSNKAWKQQTLLSSWRTTMRMSLLKALGSFSVKNKCLLIELNPEFLKLFHTFFFLRRWDYNYLLTSQEVRKQCRMWWSRVIGP